MTFQECYRGGLGHNDSSTATYPVLVFEIIGMCWLFLLDKLLDKSLIALWSSTFETSGCGTRETTLLLLALTLLI